ncbi:hypothetical protein LH5_02239 (plasmid) [Lactobacillus helveticus]|uniref:Uncharacterized protein n=1 Tax=Lactobacillus helveticus TaxID=1587 RepID=A0A3Q8SVX1_LACHE|nr:hypothetical protein LH5_02239 [Lactobacillus helveticus]
MPFFVIKKGLVLLEWKYFPTPKILDPLNSRPPKFAIYHVCLNQIYFKYTLYSEVY